MYVIYTCVYIYSFRTKSSNLSAPVYNKILWSHWYPLFSFPFLPILIRLLALMLLTLSVLPMTSTLPSPVSSFTFSPYSIY